MSAAYAVHVMVGFNEAGQTDEKSIEVASIQDVVNQVTGVMASSETWLAITIVHVEELPALLDDAQSVRDPEPTP